MAPSRRSSILGITGAVVVAALVASAVGVGGDRFAGVPAVWWCVGAAFAVNWVALVPAYVTGSERFFDLVGSLTYLATLALALTLSTERDLRSWAIAAMVAIWATRLGTFLTLRIRATGGDGRFDALKRDPLAFCLTWTLQGLWVSLTMAAAWAAITSSEANGVGSGDGTGFDVWLGVGGAIWAAGFAVEVVADEQKRRFRANPAHDGRFISSGLWAWSRHPNYFGEILLWSGVAIVALPTFDSWRWIALVSPVFVFILLTRISGIPLLERRARKRWGGEPAYERYVQSTPSLVPRPPRP